jgi:hypothetical protein
MAGINSTRPRSCRNSVEIAVFRAFSVLLDRVQCRQRRNDSWITHFKLTVIKENRTP